MSIRKQLATLATTALLSFNTYAASDIKIEDAWVRTAPPSAKVLAAYMKISNHGHHTQTLVGASSPQFKSVEIHQTQMHEGMMHMKAMESLQIDSHETVNFKPGGYHFMLIKPQGMVHRGAEIEINLNFKSGSTVKVSAEVKDADDDSDDNGGHKHHH